MINNSYLINDFLMHCKFEKNLSDKTIKAYRMDLRQFEIHLGFGVQEKNVETIDKYHIKLFLKGLFNHYKPKTIKRKIASVKAFFSYLEFEDIIKVNPFRKMKISVNEGKRLPRTIEMNVVKTLFSRLYERLNSCKEKRGCSYERMILETAVIEVLFSTGIRVAELCNIKREDVDLMEKFIRIIGKGNKERIVPICSEETFKAVSDYNVCRDYDIDNAYFFSNRLHGRLSEQSVRNMIKKIAKEAGIKENITPHMFRHTIATMLLEREVDIRYIQDLLGHSSINTTQIYLKINREAQRKILTQKHPRTLMNI